MAVLIFKPLEKCNSNCLYCDTIVKKENAVMSLDLLESLFARINEFLEAHPEEDLLFTWHGGEVCLLPPSYFEQALQLQESICGENAPRIVHTMQSNLTLITREHIDSFRRLGVTSIGTSFDPLPNIRGYGAERDSAAYNRDFFRGIALLQETGIRWGVIYTAHRGSIGHGKMLLRFLTNMNPSSPPQFNLVRCYNEGTEAFAIGDEEFADFLGDIFAEYWENRTFYGAVQPFHWFVDRIINRNDNLVCEMSGRCSHNWFFVGPKGEISHCGVSGDYHLFRYGTILDTSFDDSLGHQVRTDLRERVVRLARTECAECRFWGICHGGCPVSAVKAYGSLEAKPATCGVIRLFMEQHFEPRTGVRVELPPGYDLKPHGEDRCPTRSPH